MAKLRKHDYTMDGSDWDLSLLSLSDAPVDELKNNLKARKIDLSQNFMTKLPVIIGWVLTHNFNWYFIEGLVHIVNTFNWIGFKQKPFATIARRLRQS